MFLTTSAQWENSSQTTSALFFVNTALQTTKKANTIKADGILRDGRTLSRRHSCQYRRKHTIVQANPTNQTAYTPMRNKLHNPNTYKTNIEPKTDIGKLSAKLRLNLWQMNAVNAMSGTHDTNKGKFFSPPVLLLCYYVVSNR